MRCGLHEGLGSLSGSVLRPREEGKASQHGFVSRDAIHSHLAVLTDDRSLVLDLSLVLGAVLADVAKLVAVVA